MTPTNSNPLLVTLTGDAIIQHKFSGSHDPRFFELVELLRSSDAAMTNLEGAIQAGEDWPGFIAGQGGFGSGYNAIPPWVVEELKWFGFDLVFTANNHASDFAEGGILTTLDYLDAGGLPHSGSGRNMTEASAPTYIYSNGGRVAVINASDNGIRSRGEIPFPVPRGCFAADQGPWYPDRPGLNMIRYEPIYHVDKKTLDALRYASEHIGWEHDKELRRRGGGLLNPSIGASILDLREDTDTLFHYNGSKYTLDDEFKFETVPFEQDLERNYKSVREARGNADVVVVGMHQQGSAWNEDDPPDHTRIFAHGAIDAGADVFVGHGGSNRMCGLELYKHGVIIYGVPAFIHGQRRSGIPQEQMVRFGMPLDSTPSAVNEHLEFARANANDKMPARFGQHNPAQGHAIFSVEFGDDCKITRVLMRPLEMTKNKRIGRHPMLAKSGSEVFNSVFEVFTKRSERYGTKVEEIDGAASISVL